MEFVVLFVVSIETICFKLVASVVRMESVWCLAVKQNNQSADAPTSIHGNYNFL
jgi:hypothetical protein